MFLHPPKKQIAKIFSQQKFAKNSSGVGLTASLCKMKSPLEHFIFVQIIGLVSLGENDQWMIISLLRSALSFGFGSFLLAQTSVAGE